MIASTYFVIKNEPLLIIIESRRRRRRRRNELKKKWKRKDKIDRKKERMKEKP